MRPPPLWRARSKTPALVRALPNLNASRGVLWPLWLTQLKNTRDGCFLVGGQGGTRTLKVVKPADFKSTAYTIPPLALLEAPTGFAPVYAVLQTAA